MFRLLGALVILALIAIGIAVWRHWMTFSVNRPDEGSTNINIALNKEKFNEDVGRLQESVKNVAAAREVKGKVAGVDPEKKTVAVQHSQDTITLKVTEGTTIQIGDKTAAFADLQPGTRVTASYTAQEGANIARSIRIEAPARGEGE